MHRWPMEIEELQKKAENYETVTICAPVWVFSPSAPILSYLDQTKGKIKRLRIIVNHFQAGKDKKREGIETYMMTPSMWSISC